MSCSPESRRQRKQNMYVSGGCGEQSQLETGWRAESNNVVYLDFMKRRTDLRPGGPRCTCLHVTQSNPLGTMESVKNSHCCCRWAGMDR